MAQESTPAANTSNWPGAFGVFKPSLRTVAFNILPFLVLIALSFVSQIVITILDGYIHSELMAFVFQLASLGISFLISIALTIVLLDASESKKVELGDSFNRSLPHFWRFTGVMLLTGLIAIGSFLLLVVPFFFVFPRLILASYFTIDQNMGVMDSIKASWNQTQGHVGKVYGIIGVAILMALPMLTVIGIPVSIFLLFAYSAATVLLYKFILTGVLKDPVQEPIEVAVPKA